jgi:hypothetical protein
LFTCFKVIGSVNIQSFVVVLFCEYTAQIPASN